VIRRPAAATPTLSFVAVARPCFYCGREAIADEFGIPGWVVERVGLGGAPIEHLVSVDEVPRRAAEAPAEQIPHSIPRHAELGDEQPAARLRDSIDAAIRERTRLALEEYAARALCAACAMAMNELDARARPLLEPMVDGGAGRYTSDERRLLAAWAARAAYAALVVERKSQGVPRSHRRTLRERGEPHATLFVGFGRYRPNHVGVLAGRLLTAIDADGLGVEAYSVLLVLGHLAVKVFGVHRVPKGVRVKPPEGQMVRFWPTEHDEVSWPPIWGLTEQTLEQAFVYEPFYRPFRYSEVRYLGPGKRKRVRHKRTEGLGPHR
jgi:hypothetical protein